MGSCPLNSLPRDQVSGLVAELAALGIPGAVLHHHATTGTVLIDAPGTVPPAGRGRAPSDDDVAERLAWLRPAPDDGRDHRPARRSRETAAYIKTDQVTPCHRIANRWCG
jgi:hypothetical protein